MSTTPGPQPAGDPTQPVPSSTPQDAPVQPREAAATSHTMPDPTTPDPTAPTPSAPPAPPAALAPATPSERPAHSSRQQRAVVRIPAPGGANWGLVVYGLFAVAVAAGVIANQTSGFVVGDLFRFGPTALVGVGLLCALVGIIGMAGRGRRQRR